MINSKSAARQPPPLRPPPSSIYIISVIRSILAGWVCIAWALWLGGLGAIFLFVTRLFQVDHDLGAQAAPVLFLVFERYQLMVAALALIGTALLRISFRSSRATILFWMLGAAAALAALEPIAITSHLEQLRIAGQMHSAQFQRLHQTAGVVYTTETLILLAAGFALPGAVRARQA